MGNIGDRIKELRKEKGMTQEEFAEKLGIKRNTVATYEVGKSEPSDSAVVLICTIFNVSEVWLRTGEGEPFVEKSLNEEIKTFVDGLGVDDNFKAELFAMLVHLDPDEWDLLEKMARKLAKLDQVPDRGADGVLEFRSTAELEDIYKKEVLSGPSEPEATA